MSREVIRITFGRELMARKSENGSHWGEEKVESKHSLPRLLLFLLVFNFFGLSFFCSSSLFIFFLLSQLAYFSFLYLFPQMKSKVKNEGSVGLFTYPVLQAADILLYK